MASAFVNKPPCQAFHGTYTHAQACTWTAAVGRLHLNTHTHTFIDIRTHTFIWNLADLRLLEKISLDDEMSDFVIKIFISFLRLRLKLSFRHAPPPHYICTHNRTPIHIAVDFQYRNKFGFTHQRKCEKVEKYSSWRKWHSRKHYILVYVYVCVYVLCITLNNGILCLISICIRIYSYFYHAMSS